MVCGGFVKPVNEDIIEFKSAPIYYAKEKSGLKNNTIRFVKEDDNRFRLLNLWGIKHKYGKIKIICNESGEFFIRQIRDISKWNDYFIITWDDKNGQ